MSEETYPCNKCGENYNHKNLARCPECEAPTLLGPSAGTSFYEGLRKAKSTTLPEPENSLEALVIESIKASNRTTYAVRSVVSLTAILLMTAGATIAAQYVAAVAQVTLKIDFLTALLWLISWLIAIGGTAFAYLQFFSEWRKSKVPD